MSSLPQTTTHHQTTNLPTLLDDKQQRILDKIAQVGALTPLTIAKTAHQYPRIRELNQEEVATTFGFLFTRIAALVGVKGQIDPLQKQEIWNAVFSRFSGLSFQEIYKAFLMDRSKEFGEITEHFQFFDVSYVSTVLEKYTEWKRQTQIKHNISLQNCKVKQIAMTEEEMEENAIKWLSNNFAEYKETKTLPALSTPVYDALLKRGILKPYCDTLTEADKQLMRAETLKRMQNALNYCRDKRDRPNLKRLIELQQLGQQDREGQILSYKKQVTLQFFYDWLINQGKELLELIK